MKRNSVLYSILTLLLFSCNEPRHTAGGSKEKLVWSDEFSYTGLPDSTKWGYETGGSGWGNHELEYYTANRAENARVENGQLIIEARIEEMGGMHYTSARLVTKGKAEWQYGRIEVKARIPSGRGTWPAIWMLGATTPLNWPDDGEIDIMEHVGFHQGFIHGSVHCKKYYHSIGTQKTAITEVPDCSDNYHIYGCQWDKDSIKISVDGNTYFRFGNEHTGYQAWPFDNKLFLILNIAVGGDWGGQKGVDDTIFPKRMEIDYVRIYER